MTEKEIFRNEVDEETEMLKRNKALRILKNGVKYIEDNGYSTEIIMRITEELQNIERTSDNEELISAYDLIDMFFITKDETMEKIRKENDEALKQFKDYYNLTNDSLLNKIK